MVELPVEELEVLLSEQNLRNIYYIETSIDLPENFLRFQRKNN